MITSTTMKVHLCLRQFLSASHNNTEIVIQMDVTSILLRYLRLTVHESKTIQECLPKIITEKFDF